MSLSSNMSEFSSKPEVFIAAELRSAFEGRAKGYLSPSKKIHSRPSATAPQLGQCESTICPETGVPKSVLLNNPFYSVTKMGFTDLSEELLKSFVEIHHVTNVTQQNELICLASFVSRFQNCFVEMFKLATSSSATDIAGFIFKKLSHAYSYTFYATHRNHRCRQKPCIFILPHQILHLPFLRIKDGALERDNSLFKPNQLVLCAAGRIIPHPKKVSRGGEDAFFIEGNAFGVFDGVGSSMRMNIDSGVYARELASHVAEHVFIHGPGTVKNALKLAAGNVKKPGSSTACVAGIFEGVLIGVNLGDSGLIVIRDDKIIFETVAQHHSFNFPYQLRCTKPERVADGSCFEVPVQQGDLIIAGSDGLWDNVRKSNIVDFTKNCSYKSELREVNDRMVFTAQKLAKYSRSLAGRATGTSPFSEAAMAAGITRQGGKMDDVTVISATVFCPYQCR